MNKFTTMTIASLLAASVSTIALAQAAGDADADADVGAEFGADVGTEADAGVEAGAEADTDADVEAEVDADAEVDAVTDAEAEAETDAIAGADEAPEFGDVVSSVEADGDVGAEIDALNENAPVSVHGLSQLRGDAVTHTPALDHALIEREERTLHLRTAVRTRVSLNAALEAAGYSADDLVAVIVEADGRVRLIVDDR